MGIDQQWWVECGAYNGGNFLRNHVCLLGEEELFRNHHKNLGVFRTIYQYDSPEIRTANMVGDFCLDFDADLSASADPESAYAEIRRDVLRVTKTLERAYGIPPMMMRYFFSGAKGIHMMIPWVVFGIRPQAALHLIWKQAAIELRTFSGCTHLDAKIYDKVRLFRMPNSIHQKTGLYKIPLTPREAVTISLDEIKELAKEPREIEISTAHLIIRAKDMVTSAVNAIDAMLQSSTGRRKTDHLEWNGELPYVPPCMAYLMENPPQSGTRNDSMASLASFFRQNGMPEAQALESLADWGLHCAPPVEQQETETTVRSIYRSGAMMGCSRAQQVAPCNINECRMHRRDI